MAAKIVIKTLGLQGVNVDKDPLELSPDELTKAQNAISEVLGARAAVKNRLGLTEHTTDSGMGPVLGGINVLESGGTTDETMLMLGRGGTV